MVDERNFMLVSWSSDENKVDFSYVGNLDSKLSDFRPEFGLREWESAYLAIVPHPINLSDVLYRPIKKNETIADIQSTNESWDRPDYTHKIARIVFVNKNKRLDELVLPENFFFNSARDTEEYYEFMKPCY